MVIPLYNKEHYVARAIQSVFDQTFQDFEIIIVDDGSTDRSMEAVKNFDDPRIHLISQKNAGVSAARNKGISEAQYTLISFLDADDYWEKDFLATMWRLYEKYENCSVFAVNYRILLNNGTMQTPIINGLPEDFREGVLNDYFQIAAKSDPIICSISFAVKKNAIEAIDGFPLSIRAGEDLLTWAKLAAHFDIAYSLEPKAVFSREEASPDAMPRIPDTHDKVGEGLRALLLSGNTNRISGLKEYIAYWHKIRVAIFLRLGMQKEARKEFYKMSEFAHKDLKYFVYALLVFSPNWMSKGLEAFVSWVNIYRRKYLSNGNGGNL
ncbi:glycosyltransferase family A protein [Sulfurovum sp. zt1-1]|uniref:Glycosyltransferase family A protein n=1 Tax=Sulfurovum zhangzhouensis TaxID=3019067 RepID=A0ABT7R0C3_9BACT|nr:glycosyltransferase family A protein [Sulfurovum zhangzhouensis]MDM5272546.1 glycosyltransferase family A protein [Sulfurovum zhangzhouensis]